MQQHHQQQQKWIINNNCDNLDVYFEQLDKAATHHFERKEALKKDLESPQSNAILQKLNQISTIKDDLDFGHEIKWQSNEDRNNIYTQILYTINHKVGKTLSGSHVDSKDELISYTRGAFADLKIDEHKNLYTEACNEKAPIIVLNVEVLEAEGLVAKDPNGFSDPYCMLGIIQGAKPSHFESVFISDDDICSSPSISERRREITRNSTRIENKEKKSFIKRFSSFRRSDKSAANLIAKSRPNNDNNQTFKKPYNINSSSENSSRLRAKFIQATTVKNATLNPVWNEKFHCNVDDLNLDTLHIDIWDHDDEVNVFDAVKKLNEVKGLKGLDRYFKQIAQSARISSEDGANAIDDFLGTLNIKLNNLPSNGLSQWYTLESAGAKSKVEGKLKLKLSLTTSHRFGQALNKTDDLEVHEQLIRVFVAYELSQLVGKKTKDWSGVLSLEAETILHQHAIQTGLTDYQVSLCRWIAFVKSFIEKELNYDLILKLLNDLGHQWKAEIQTTKETNLLRTSFHTLTTECFKLITNMRYAFPVTQNRQGLNKLENVLKLLITIHNIAAFKYCNPFSNSLSHELGQLLKNNSCEWVEKTRDNFFQLNDEANLSQLVSFSTTIYLDLYLAFKYYSPLFENMANVNYFQILFKQVDRTLYDLLKKILVDEFGDDVYLAARMYKTRVPHGDQVEEVSLSIELEKLDLNEIKEELQQQQKMSSSVSYNIINEQAAIMLFNLYITTMAITKFKNRLSEIEMKQLKLNAYHELFYLSWNRWIDLFRQKIEVRIRNRFEIEKTNQNPEASSSAVVCTVLNLMVYFWKLVQWPDIPEAKVLLKQVINLALTAALNHTQLIRDWNEKLVESCFKSELNTVIDEQKSNVFKKLISTTNQLQRVKEATKQFVSEMLDFSFGAKRQNKCQNELILAAEIILRQSANQFGQVIHATLEILIENKFLSELNSHFFYLFESPDYSSANQSSARLVSFINKGLVDIKPIAFKINFDKICKQLWQRLVEVFAKNAFVDKKRSKFFFSKMYESMEILEALISNQTDGRCYEYITGLEKYSKLKALLKLQTMDTTHLIQMFYQRLAQSQKTAISKIDYGKLFCSAYYLYAKDTLVVTIIRCKSLKAMDQNGLSDPYVVIELRPKFLFYNLEKKTTAIIKGSLNPVFNETFEFKIPKSMCIANGNVVHFTIMDHDIFMSNDFEGEACLELNQLPGIKADLAMSETNSLPIIELFLTNPKDSHCQILEALEYRETDKLATEFIRIRRSLV